MPLIRSKSQGGGSCCEHYKNDIGNDGFINRRHAGMRSLINKLNAQLQNTTVWGLTSLDTLCLMAVPMYDAGPRYVAIDAISEVTFRVNYRPPEGQLPIPGSEISFSVLGVDEAVDLIKKAMQFTQGWPGSPDLEMENRSPK